MAGLGTHSAIERADLVTPRLKVRALNFYPDIRLLRSRWRGLETESRFGLHGHEWGNPGYRQDQNLTDYRASPRPYRDAERRRRDDSEIYCKCLVQMFAQKRCPSLPGARWGRALRHIT